MPQDRQTKNGRTPSTKLAKTLEELEGAFSQWESLGAKPAPLVSATDKRKAKDAEVSEKEFRKKTKKLLNQLRQQLEDLD